jgi:Spy/CpxP family protein refolding chaperone
MHRRIVLIALVVLLGCAAPARAEGPFPKHGPPRGDAGLLLPLLLRSAELTPDQQTKVQEIVSAHRVTTRRIVEQLRQAQADLADKLFAPGALPEADLAAPLQQIAQLRAQLLQQSARVALEVRGLLTPEQLAKAAQVKDRMRTLETEMRQLLQPVRP